MNSALTQLTSIYYYYLKKKRKTSVTVFVFENQRANLWAIQRLPLIDHNYQRLL